MTKTEILILILASCIPFFSFYLAFKPKFKKSAKKKDGLKAKDEVEKVEESKPEDKPKELVQEPIKEQTLSDEISGAFHTSNFNDYPKAKRSKVSFPEMKYNKDFMPTYDLEEFDKPKPKTIAEQIKSLSPELKALMVAGVLDKKDIDNI